MEKLFCGYREFSDNGRMVFMAPGGKGPDVPAGGAAPESKDADREAREREEAATKLIVDAEKAATAHLGVDAAIDRLAMMQQLAGAKWELKEGRKYRPKLLKGDSLLNANESLEVNGKDVRFRDENGKAVDKFGRGERIKVLADSSGQPVRLNVGGVAFVRVEKEDGKVGYVAEKFILTDEEKALRIARRRPDEFKEEEGKLKRADVPLRQVLIQRLDSMNLKDKQVLNNLYALWDVPYQKLLAKAAKGGMSGREFEQKVNEIYRKIFPARDIFVDRTEMEIRKAALLKKQYGKEIVLAKDGDPAATFNACLEALGYAIGTYCGQKRRMNAQEIKDAFGIQDTPPDWDGKKGGNLKFDYTSGKLFLFSGRRSVMEITGNAAITPQGGPAPLATPEGIRESTGYIVVQKPLHTFTLQSPNYKTYVDSTRLPAMASFTQEKVDEHALAAVQERGKGQEVAEAEWRREHKVETGPAVLETLPNGDVRFRPVPNASIIDVAQMFYGRGEDDVDFAEQYMPKPEGQSFVYNGREKVVLPQKLGGRDRIKNE